MEEQIYEITNFYTQKPRPVSKYKIVDNEAELRFNESTKFQVVKDTFPPIPQYSFHVLEFDQFGAQVKTQEVLIDVYGCIKSVLPEHQVNVKDSTKLESKCEVFIENLRTSHSNSNKSYVHIIDPHNSAASEYIAEFSKPRDKVKILPVPFKRPTAEELKNQMTKWVFELNTLNPDSYVCIALLPFRFPAYRGWSYRGCLSCSRVLKVKEDGGEFLCPKHNVQIPLPCYKVYVTIHDDYNQATVILMRKQEQQLFSISCQDLVNKRLYPTEQTLPEKIKKMVGQTYLFEIQINQYGELLVKNVFPSQQSSASVVEQNPSTATPERLSSEKREALKQVEKHCSSQRPRKKPRGNQTRSNSVTIVNIIISKQGTILARESQLNLNHSFV